MMYVNLGKSRAVIAKMDISNIGLTLLLKGKVVIKDEENVWEFYLKDGRNLTLIENGVMRGQKPIRGLIVLPNNVRECVEYLIGVLGIDVLIKLLKIPPERVSFRKNSQ